MAGPLVGGDPTFWSPAHSPQPQGHTCLLWGGGGGPLEGVPREWGSTILEQKESPSTLSVCKRP